jgi:hypothetical protein
LTDVTPQDFDFDAWLDGAERPARSVTVYQRAGLIAELGALEDRILAADDEAESQERGLSEQSESQRLTAEYQRLAQQFHASALVIKVQGHDEEEKREIARANKDNEDVAYVVLADAIQSPRVTPEQVKRLAAKVGEVQFGQILGAYHKACTELPSVSADFLPKRSTQGAGGE